MKKIVKGIVKWVLRILLGLVGLIFILLLLFYLFRGKITDKAIDIVNKSQPGEVHLGSLNLRPFLNFPDFSVQLKNLELYEVKTGSELEDTIPVLSMDEIFVSLNIYKLLKKKYLISKIRIIEGSINYAVGSDSISNVEKALGILFSDSDTTDNYGKDTTAIELDLESLEIRNLVFKYSDLPGKIKISGRINGLESEVSYNPDTISAKLMLHMDINSANIDKILLDKPRSVSFSSSLLFDQIHQKIFLDNTALDLEDALMELSGEVDLAESLVEMEFSAKNRGIELLNFLLNGVLDLDAIEQIGDGLIDIYGKASGSFKEAIPKVELNFSASEVGFRVHSINQSVTQIGFEGYATNGSKKDFSEALVKLDNFHVTFPEGSMDANLQLSNLTNPYALIDISGDADLAIIGEIVKSDAIKDLKGKLTIEGHVDSKVDRVSGGFLDNAGFLSAELGDVQLSIPGYEIQKLDGEIYFEKNSIFLRNLDVKIDSNELHLEISSHNIIPFLMGSMIDPAINLTLSSKELYLEKFIGDSLLKGPVQDLEFRLLMSANAVKLKDALEEGTIPTIALTLRDFYAKIPGYSDISNLRFQVVANANDFEISKFKARIGETNLDFEGQIRNYGAYLNKDSVAKLGISLNIGSKDLQFKDLLYFNDEFIALPEVFINERMKDFRFRGNVETSVGELLDTNNLPDFKFLCDEFHFTFVENPIEIKDFKIDVEHQDSLIRINTFEGTVGESNFDVKGVLSNLLDSAQLISGYLTVKSDLLDLEEILAYELLAGSGEVSGNIVVDTIPSAPLDLSLLDFPDLDLNLNLKELRVEGNVLYGIQGDLRLRPYKVLYFDKFGVQSKTGGSLVLDGQFNVSDPDLYMLSASIYIDTVDIRDFNLQIAVEDTVYSLEDNFNGILSTDGIAELFINPDFSINMDYSTAMFSVRLENGRVKNFTPLHALAKFTGNKDLDNIKFGLLRNSFTLINGAVQIPLMSIESNLGLILLEGEQKLDGDFLYLARVPVKLVRGTAWNVVTNQQRKESEEAEVQKMEAQKFLMVTISSQNGVEDVKIGDRREKFE